MKHTLKITFLLVLMFFLSQIIGLLVLNNYIDYEKTKESGNLSFINLPYGMQRPQTEGISSFGYILLAIIFGTLLMLVIIKLNKKNLWKIWFLFAVILTLSISFSAFINPRIAFISALILALWKILKPNVFVHNFTELFIYGGLAVIFVPVMNLWSAYLLMIAISIYDMIAVWKSKHMIKLAKFQTKSNIFAGFFLPYKLLKKEKKEMKKGLKKEKVKTAILGGGDIGFTLLFSGTVMKYLMLENVFFIGFLKSLIVPFFATIALLLLFLKSKPKRFYPAMPFLSLGCFVGFLIMVIFRMF